MGRWLAFFPRQVVFQSCCFVLVSESIALGLGTRALKSMESQKKHIARDPQGPSTSAVVVVMVMASCILDALVAFFWEKNILHQFWIVSMVNYEFVRKFSMKDTEVEPFQLLRDFVHRNFAWQLLTLKRSTRLSDCQLSKVTIDGSEIRKSTSWGWYLNSRYL